MTQKRNYFMVCITLLICLSWAHPTTPRAAEQENSIKPPSLSATEYVDGIFSTRTGVDLTKFNRKWIDIAYANESPLQKLDIYLPEDGQGPFQVIIAIHGGSFVKGDKQDFQIVPMLEALKWRYAIVSVNYRLSPQATFPSQIRDLKAAIRWIRANGDKYLLDTKKIAVWGDSAGGNLAALAGTSAGVKNLEDLNMGNPKQDSHVDAVVDWYGPIDFLSMSSQLQQNNQPSRKGNSSYIGKSKDEAPEQYAAANPASYTQPGLPPFLIQHGNSDIVIPVQQSIEFANLLKATTDSQRVTIDILKGANHLDEQFTTTANLNKVRTFLDTAMKDSANN